MNKLKYNSGQVMMVGTIFFVVISLVVIYGVVEPLVRQKRITANAFTSRQSYFVAEGAVEDIVRRLKAGTEVAASETLTLGDTIVTVTTADTDEGSEIVALADTNSLLRKVRVEMALGEGVSFHYGVQAGVGGIILENTSSISGNAYANGPVTGSGLGNNTIRGDVISAGPSGLFSGIYATSSAYAHTISNARVGKDAYYTSISNTTVAGTSYPNSVDQVASVLPITDEMVDEWKAEAEAGGTYAGACPYNITSATTIGPIKIPCDLNISGNNYSVTIVGNVWVEGNITISNSPTIKADAALGNRGAAIVADKESNRLTSSKISIANSTVFVGTGQPKSFMFMISQNNSAENGGSEAAISVQNTVSGDLLVYSGHGELQVQNNVNLREATGYRIRLKNSAVIQYKTGLSNLLFTEGPSGGYEILNWQEIE